MEDLNYDNSYSKLYNNSSSSVITVSPVNSKKKKKKGDWCHWNMEANNKIVQVSKERKQGVIGNYTSHVSNAV